MIDHKLDFTNTVSITLIFTGNHTIAVVNGPESRQTLEECFSDVFREINEVNKLIMMDASLLNKKRLMWNSSLEEITRSTFHQNTNIR